MSIRLLLLAAALAPAAFADVFRESLTLHPLPDGKLSVLFEFTTEFELSRETAARHHSHHSLAPPALILPLQHNDVSELSISFVSGRWDQHRTGRAGPLHYGSGGEGGEVRGWLRDDVAAGAGGSAEDAWGAVTNALGGLFCATLGPAHVNESVRSFGGVYPPTRGSSKGLTHFYLPHPNQQLCTENLTPFLSLLPSKGLSGLSTLLAQPGIVLGWGFKAEGIHVLMPDAANPTGEWTGWWEGVVDLVPTHGGARSSGTQSLFRRTIARPFPEAHSSVLRLIRPRDERFRVEPRADAARREWVDGREEEALEWDLQRGDLTGKDVRFWWDGEGQFSHPTTFHPTPIAISRRIIDPIAGDGTFLIRIANSSPLNRTAVYTEVWPWWVKGWISEMTVATDRSNGELAHIGDDDLLQSLAYHPSHPPSPSTTSLHLSLVLPAHSVIEIQIPYSKLTLKYTEHRPDAERGIEIPSGVLTLVDLELEDEDVDQAEADKSPGAQRRDPLKSARRHIYSQRLLLDVPTPDFSMPYNVIIMSSTVMAVFFGLVQGALTRRWGVVQVASAAPGKQGTAGPEKREEAAGGKELSMI